MTQDWVFWGKKGLIFLRIPLVCLDGTHLPWVRLFSSVVGFVSAVSGNFLF